MIEDAMLHHGRCDYRAMKMYLKRLRELRRKLAKAKTPEEVNAIEKRINELRQDFDFIETAVEIR